MLAAGRTETPAKQKVSHSHGRRKDRRKSNLSEEKKTPVLTQPKKFTPKSPGTTSPIDVAAGIGTSNPLTVNAPRSAEEHNRYYTLSYDSSKVLESSGHQMFVTFVSLLMINLVKFIKV